jgi:5-methylcytosine-specific restriction endonuclease McrA
LEPKTIRVKLSEQEYKKQSLEIFERQGWRCAKCGRLKPLTRDHIRKRSQLGGDEESNAQGLCADCHEQKDNVAKSKSRYWK